MEKLRKVMNEIAYTSPQNLCKLSIIQHSLIPFLSFASSLYKFSLSIRQNCYYLGLFHSHRLPVPVISVGNLTWGGNGKTPMAEFIALCLHNSEISPLILTRGYAGGDEANMLKRHLNGTSVKIGVGANRTATASSFLQKYGFTNPHVCMSFDRFCIDQNMGIYQNSDNIGAVILDDGMQHIRMQRDLEIVMVNGLSPWGNGKLIPLGPLRESLTSLKRADVVVVHHADLVSEQTLKDIGSMIHAYKESLPIFFSKMSASHFFSLADIHSKRPLDSVCNKILLCISAIGFSNAFVQGMKRLRPLYVDRVDFSDHHLFETKDIEMIGTRIRNLEGKFSSQPIVVVTEKDYDRDSEILKRLNPFEVLVLCSHLQIAPSHDSESFKMILLKHLSRA